MQHERPTLKLTTSQAQALSEKPDDPANSLPVPLQAAARALLEVTQMPHACRPDVRASHHHPADDGLSPRRDRVIR